MLSSRLTLELSVTEIHLSVRHLVLSQLNLLPLYNSDVIGSLGDKDWFSYILSLSFPILGPGTGLNT